MAYDTVLLKCTVMIMNFFLQELQKGFFILSVEGKTLYTFLTEDCGISDGYITEKIKTILVDGGPVDDIFNTKIRDGGICALSGAMPGIVGAMMRMGSPYAPMRESITVKPDQSHDSGKEIKLGLKLFNTVLSDRGLDFLKQGILIEKIRIAELFQEHGDEIYSDCREISVNGLPCESRMIFSGRLSESVDFVILKIEIHNEN